MVRTRTRNGVAYRMCTQTGFHSALPEFTVPEMQNGDMLQEVLDILRLGHDPLTFPYMSAPSTEVVAKAFGILSALGAIKVSQVGLEITSRGLAISRLPVPVYHAIMLLESPKFGSQDEILSLVAMLEATEDGRTLFLPPMEEGASAKIQAARKHFGQKSGDHIILLNIYLAYREACRFGSVERDNFIREHYLVGSVLKTADLTRGQLLDYLCGESSDIWKPAYSIAPNPSLYNNVLGVLAASNFLRVAQRAKPAKELKPKDPVLWKTVRHGSMARIVRDGCEPHPECDWVVYEEFSNAGPGSMKLRMVTPIPLDLIIGSQPAFWSQMNLTAGGKAQDAIVKTIADMGGFTEAYVRQSMPPAPQASQSSAPQISQPAAAAQ
jgi:HrpA-like RNA helicase